MAVASLEDPSRWPHPDIFYAFFDHGPERAQAITYPAMVDQLLEKVLRAALRKDVAVAAEFFGPSGTLGTTAAKIRLLYMLGIIGRKTYKDLTTVVKIRNRFAHDVEIKSFSQSPIKQWVDGMHVSDVLRTLRDEPIPDDLPENQMRFRTALKFTLTEQMNTPLGVYREGIRIYAHKLEGLISSMEKFHKFAFSQADREDQFP